MVKEFNKLNAIFRDLLTDGSLLMVKLHIGCKHSQSAD